MYNLIVENLKKLFTKLFGSKPTINNTDSNGNSNLSGNNNTSNSNNNNNNNNIDNSVKTYNTPKTELETKKELLICKKDLYEHILSYRQSIYGIDPIKLADMDIDNDFLDAIKELQTNIDLEINLLKKYYPDLCVLAKNAFDSISNYYSVAVPYGILHRKVTLEKNDDKQIIKFYDERSSEISPLIEILNKSFTEYMIADRK